MGNPHTALLQHGFEKWCKESADKIAVVYDVGQHKSTVTYGELDRLSDALKNQIKGYTNGALTVACLCKSSPLIPALMLGILKASCAFAFLDIHSAKCHFANICKTAVVRLLIAEEELFESAWDHSQWEVVQCSWSTKYILAENRSHFPAGMPTDFNTNMNIAYVMQTSGSTGEPKIVRVPHRCIVPNINHLSELLTISSEDVVFQAAPLTFDPCVVETFLTLASGATLFLTSDSVKMIPSLVSSLLVKNAVSVMQVTPSFFLKMGRTRVRRTLLARESRLRVLAFGGETCPTSGLLDSWREDGNKTEFYNVYGITEVSCWATCCRIDVTNPSSEPVPLGDPLQGTVLEIRDESGRTVDQGVGSLFVGGTERWCLIDGENPEDPDACHMRDTGDVVQKSRDGSLTYVGRRNRTFKYNGKKIVPVRLEEILKRIPLVQDCCCHFVKERELLFVFVLLPAEEDCESTLKSINKALREGCQCPHRAVPVTTFPLTSHGKLDIRALTELADKKCKTLKLSTITEQKALLTRLWKELAAKEANDKIDPDSNFILTGGNSLGAVTMSRELELAVGHAMPLLVETIINSTFSDVEAYVDFAVEGGRPKESTELRKRKRDPVLEHSCVSVARISSCFRCVSRFDTWVRCQCGGDCNFAGKTSVEGTSRPRLHLDWKYDLSKCVDASPLLVHYAGGDTILFVGSHYGKFCAVDGATGACFWEARVPDRIESSACISACGEYVAFGCYDHHIYCLTAQSGTLHWKFRTEGEVKSSPTLNRTNGSLLCGSHDKHIYCVEFTTGELKWKRRISEGSVFATPVVSYNPYRVYGATLDGKIDALLPDSGDTLWSVTLSKPVFSSPLALDLGVCACCVGGTVCLLDHGNGSVLWTTKVGGPVFSSPTRLQEPVPSIVFGCHDNCLYVVKETDGSVLLSLSVDSPVYSTAFYTTNTGEAGAIVTASSSGTLYVVDCCRGAVLTSHQLPGQVFSSPLVYGNSVVVGCRDNYVYSLSLC